MFKRLWNWILQKLGIAYSYEGERIEIEEEEYEPSHANGKPIFYPGTRYRIVGETAGGNHVWILTPIGRLRKPFYNYGK